MIENGKGSNVLAVDHAGIVSEHALTFLRKRIQDEFRFDPGAEYLVSAIYAVAEEHRFNPVVSWLNGLSWDGQQRLDNWFPSVIGCADTPLNRSAGALVITSMIARARYPGSKFDLCVVLEGEQGCGKSSFVRRLASGPGETLYVDAPGLIGMPNKDRAELIVGKWVVELAELSGLAKSETEGVKAFLTQPSDRYRAPYARVASDRHRTCVFIGTTNAQAYLNDATGNRRFLPIRCGAIDLVQLDANRDQLFAEADRKIHEEVLQARSAGISIIDYRPLPLPIVDACLTLPSVLWAAAAEETEARRTIDHLEEAINMVLPRLAEKATKLSDGRRFVSSADLLSALRLHINGSFSTSGLGNWLARMGWVPETTGPKNQRVRGYAKS